MNIKEKIAAALVIIGAASPSFATSSVSFQDVVFSAQALDSDTLSFTITGADTASGNWAGVHYLKAFSFKDIGSIASATVVSGPSFALMTESGKELSANGCTGGQSGGACFTFSTPAALTHSMTWKIDFVAAAGRTLNFDAPHLKVEFFKTLSAKKSSGDLLSQNMSPIVTAVPEPESYAMLLAGLCIVGVIARRRKSRTR